MASNRKNLELLGEDHIPGTGVLVIANRLSFEDLLHVEKQLSGRKLVYLTESSLEYDPLLRLHLDKPGIKAMEFSSDEKSRDAFKRELHDSLSEDSVIIFVPVPSHPHGTDVTVPSFSNSYQCRGWSYLFVDHPEESAIPWKALRCGARYVSFGSYYSVKRPTSRISRRVSHAAEAYSQRPILKSNLPWEILKGLKKHSKTAEIIDGLDGKSLRFDKLLAAAIVLSKYIREATDMPRIGVILPPGKGGILCNAAVLLAGKVPVNLNFTAGEKAIESCIGQALDVHHCRFLCS